MHQNMKKIQKQRQEDLEKHPKELKQQKETENDPSSSNIFSQDSTNW